MARDVRSPIPTLNSSLVTIDHVEIGHVIALGARSFHAALPAGPKWLMNECIYTVEPSWVTLVCSEPGLTRYYAK